MAFSGAQITRLGASGIPAGLYGSFANKAGAFGPHPVGEITRLAPHGVAMRLYGSFADKGEAAAAETKSGVRRLQQARDFAQQDPDWKKYPTKRPILSLPVKEKGKEEEPAEASEVDKAPVDEPVVVTKTQPDVFVDIDVARVHAAERLKTAQAQAEVIYDHIAKLEAEKQAVVKAKAAKAEARRLEIIEEQRIAAEKLAFLQDEEEAMMIILMAADM